jgi:GAF domain-containing protein
VVFGVERRYAPLVNLKQSLAVRAARRRVKGVPDPSFTQIASQLKAQTEADAGFISFVTNKKAYVVGNDGLAPANAQPAGIDVGLSFCAQIIRENTGGLVVENTRDFPLLEHCPTTAEWGSWVGAPITFRGEKIGAVGVTAAEPRRWPASTLSKVQDAAEAVRRELGS